MGDFGKTSLIVAAVLALAVCALHEAKAAAGTRIVVGCGSIRKSR